MFIEHNSLKDTLDPGTLLSRVMMISKDIWSASRVNDSDYREHREA